MPKPYSVTPRLPIDSAIYIATFYNSENTRITRSLSTDNLDKAKILCAGFVALKNAGVRTLDHALALEAFVDPDCYEFYFSLSQLREADVDQAPSEIAAGIAAARALPVDVTMPETPKTRNKIKNERRQAVAFRAQAGKFKAGWDQEKAERSNEQRSMLAHATRAAANAPAFDVARVQYAAHLAATVQKPRTYIRALENFLSYADETKLALQNVGDVRPGHVIGFLDAKGRAEDETKKATRRHNLRKYIGCFFNWCAEKFEIVSPMSGVKTVPMAAVRRERGEIDWHSLEDIQAALAVLPWQLRDAGLPVTMDEILYWRALIGTLAFAGLQLAELCWLRVQDIQFPKGRQRAKLWVTTVEDPTDKTVRHLLKTDNRRRHVDVHPRYLLPLLLAHLDSGRAGDYFVFPMAAKRKRKGFVASGGRWLEDSLGHVLRGDPGGKDRAERIGLLPAAMNAKSLRRTFGSLLIRSGKSTEQVAAAMGNTPEVVREHYARILGCEVDVDF